MQGLKLALLMSLAAAVQACGDGGGSSGDPDTISVDGGTNQERILVVDQGPPSLLHIDIGQSGGSHGDVLVFDADVTSTEGLSGKLSGRLITVEIPELDQVIHDRIAEKVFDFGGAGTLVVGGKSVYPFDGSGAEEMAFNTPQIRPVIGGTGDFLGALGQVATTRNDDLSYQHTFRLVGITQWAEPSSASAGQRTITLNQAAPNVVDVDFGSEGRSRGDLLAVDAQFTSTEGLTGKLSGIITTVDLPEPGEAVFQDRFFKGVFDFGQANTLVVLGKSVYPPDASGTDELGVDVPSIKPVVGGTGEFIGARGQVVTTRREDGTYTQEFQLVGISTSETIAAQHSTLILDQALPYLVHVDVGLEGGSHGDILAFDAEVTSTEGLLGKLSGIITTVDIPSPGDALFEDRIVHMVFDLGNANTLVVAGKSVYPSDRGPGSEFAKNIPQTRAIIGGTGEYMAAQGQVATTRNADGSYTHGFKFAPRGRWESND